MEEIVNEIKMSTVINITILKDMNDMTNLVDIKRYVDAAIHSLRINNGTIEIHVNGELFIKFNKEDNKIRVTHTRVVFEVNIRQLIMGYIRNQIYEVES